jgi:hypothetical protein
MADRGDADVLEILGGQVRQHLGVNVVVPKHLFVALQAQLAQPSRNVHGRPAQFAKIVARTLLQSRSGSHQSAFGFPNAIAASGQTRSKLPLPTWSAPE